MNPRKLCVSVFAFTLSLGIILPVVIGKLYPFVNIVFTLGILLTINLAWRDRSLHQTVPFYISIITVLAILYRLRIFLYPESLLGIDPDGYAIRMTQVIDTGNISSIEYGFYTQAPFHFLEGIIASLITGLSTPTANLVFPILGGATLPLLAASFAHRLRPNSPKTTVLAAGGASILAYSVRYSYLPIAQTSGTLFAVFTIFSILVYSSGGDRRWLAIALLAIVGAIYTHKLSAIVATLSVTGALFVGLLHPKTRRSSAVQRLMGGVVGLFGVLTVVQLLYVTGLASVIIFRLAVPDSATVAAPTPTSAFDPYSLGDRLFKLSYVLLLAVLAGLAWVASLWRTLRTDRNRQVVLFLGFVAPLAGLVVLLYPVGVNPIRTIFYSEILLFVLIAVGLYWPIVETTNFSQKITRLGTIGVVLLLVTTAGVSPIAGPDWGSEYRGYLNEEEVGAKEWGYEYVPGSITTDQYYAIETPPSRIAMVESRNNIDLNKFVNGGEIYLNNTFRQDRPPVVAHRYCIDTFRSSHGVWRLTYDAGSVLSTNYNQVYNSGCVSVFAT
ncbi:hypothetical protein PNP59_11930 [Halobacterium salinarum]|uniref:hypothetical protein n=1 Tax=Halobacterium salinarum TaxID=2242 RepID=UPI0025562970|nr:hypothetical protein [Halobacterium salinarum]MDL0131630.1 hypothetical protein [Halobacterium salinarum]